MHQLKEAQKFLDSNHGVNFDLLLILLRRIMPEEYHQHIAMLKPGKPAASAKQQPNIYCITGGNNIITPNAQDVIINIVDIFDMLHQERDDVGEEESDPE